MKNITLGFIACFIYASGICQHAKEHFSFPAEFEKQEAIWMGWRPLTYTGINKSESLLQIIKALTPHVKVNLFIDEDSLIKPLYENMYQLGIDTGEVSMFIFPHTYSNVRDPGPVFLKSSKGDLAIADMKWSFYGAVDPAGPIAERIDTIDQYVAGKLNLPVFTSTVVSEGGDREFNGKGVMMAVGYTEMHRNKGLSRDSIEKELLRMFGQKKMIWLDQGAAEDDPDKVFSLPTGKVLSIGVNHIDEFARFVSSNTILLAQVTKEESERDTVHKISYQRLEENYRILRNATDQDGRHFKIIRVPVPEMMTTQRFVDPADSAVIRNLGLPPGGGEAIIFMATSYLNFLVTNGLVVMPCYWKPGRSAIIKQKDREAKAIIEKAFPGRKVIAINVEALNEGGGGIHCATQQQPVSN